MHKLEKVTWSFAIQSSDYGSWKITLVHVVIDYNKHVIDYNIPMFKKIKFRKPVVDYNTHLIDYNIPIIDYIIHVIEYNIPLIVYNFTSNKKYNNLKHNFNWFLCTTIGIF